MASRVLVLLLLVGMMGCNPQVPIYLTAPPALSGAAVRVDGEQVATFEDADPAASPDEAGTTAIFKVRPGSHVIRVEKDGYEPVEISIDYESDEEGYLDIRPDQVRRVSR